MKPFQRLISAAAILALGALALPRHAVAAGNDKGLVDLLASQLGVTKTQAAGGAGSILGYAKGNMSKENFGKVAAAIPETNSLLKAAPKADTGSSLLGGVGSVAGGAGAVGALSGSFKKLGLKSDMIGKFIPIVVNYAQSKGGSSVSKLLSGALGVGGK